MRAALPRLLLAALALLSIACSRQPDGEIVSKALQAELDAALGGRVLQVENLRRAGSASAQASKADGTARLVYYNARLKLVRDYDFSRWDAHNVGTLAGLLGTGPKGIEGMKADGNRAGEELGVYGALAFEQSGNEWSLTAASHRGATEASPGPIGPVAGAPRAAPREVEDAGPAEAAFEKMRKLAATPATANVPAEARDRIIAEELGRAYANARVRLERGARAMTLAGGPAGGAYAEVAQALEARAKAADIPLSVTTSAGSLGNLRQLAAGEAQFALAQNDVVVTAFLGRGRFAGAPQSGLRAVASLFPEPVHLVTTAASGIRTVEDLRGKRVGLGPEDSGTRVNAIAILAAAGIQIEALSIANAAPLPDAAGALAKRELDAIFTTIHPPSAVLAQLAARTELAWIDIPASATPRDIGLVPLAIPTRTYPGQTKPVQTVAATALLVTRADVPTQQVESILKLLFDATDPRRAQSAPLAQINRRTAREGVTIPWYPAADAFLGAKAATN